MRALVAPGWRGGAERARVWVEAFRGEGLGAEPVILPFAAGPATERFLAEAGPDDVLAGVSFGGRVASLAAARAPVRALVCFAFPLRDQGAVRTAHWPEIACPVLLVSGDRDPWAPVAELRLRLRQLRNGRLEVLRGSGHSLDPALAVPVAARFLATLGR